MSRRLTLEFDHAHLDDVVAAYGARIRAHHRAQAMARPRPTRALSVAWCEVVQGVSERGPIARDVASADARRWLEDIKAGTELPETNRQLARRLAQRWGWTTKNAERVLDEVGRIWSER